MRRERSQSFDRGRPHVPRWDNPSGQLPGTGIPSGIDSGLYGFSDGTSRRRDSSVPERSRVRTSESGMSAGGVSSGDNAQTLTAMANAAIVSQLQERARVLW